MATIEENINRAIADFDAIAEVLKANGIDTKDLTTSDYAEHINETIQVGGTTITLEETEDGVTVIATNKNGETTTAVIKDGQNGTNGTNGTSCTHSWNGTTLTVTSASGTSSANLKGATGAAGTTPLAHKDGTGGIEVILATLGPREGIIAICTWSSGGTMYTDTTDGTVLFNGSAMTSSKSVTGGMSYVVTNTSTSNSARIYIKGNGGASFTIIGDI